MNNGNESNELNLEVGSYKDCYPCFIVGPNAGVSVDAPNTIGSEVVELVDVTSPATPPVFLYRAISFYKGRDPQGRRAILIRRKSDGPQGSYVVPAESSLVGSGAAALAAAAQDRVAANAADDVVTMMSETLAIANNNVVNQAGPINFDNRNNLDAAPSSPRYVNEADEPNPNSPRYNGDDPDDEENPDTGYGDDMDFGD